jgi:hypothetical protein
MVDMVLRQHNTMYGPPQDNQDANQYLIPPTDNSIYVPYFSWHTVWATNTNGDYVETGFRNTTGQYLPIFWDPYYDPNMVLLIVTTYPAVLCNWHEHVERLHAMELHTPFESVLQPILGRTYDIYEDNESKLEVVFNTDITGHVERELDAIHVPDDANATLSLI